MNDQPKQMLPETYGKRRVPRLIAKLNQLRSTIRAEGTPATQDAWDEVEPFIDFLFEEVGRRDINPITARET